MLPPDTSGRIAASRHPEFGAGEKIAGHAGRHDRAVSGGV